MFNDKCKNHPYTPADHSCKYCNSPYCKSCINFDKSIYYCNSVNCMEQYHRETKERQKNKKQPSKILYIVIFVIVSSIIGTFVKMGVKEFFKSPEHKIETTLIQIADELNKKSPMMIDEETRLDSAHTLDKEIHYNYSIINYSNDEIDKEILESEVKSNILLELKSRKELKILKDNHVVFVYNYNDKYGDQIITFRFTPQDYR